MFREQPRPQFLPSSRPQKKLDQERNPPQCFKDILCSATYYKINITNSNSNSEKVRKVKQKEKKEKKTRKAKFETCPHKKN